MTDSRTRVRVARVAAGAVFLAGVSLTAVGTASALEASAGLSVSFTQDEEPEVPENTTDVNVNAGSEGNTTEDPGNTTEDPGNTTEDPGNTTEDPGNTTEDPGNTTEDPGNTTEDPGDGNGGNGSNGGSTGTNGGSTGGDGGSTGGQDTATTGGGDGGPNTCILDESTVDCGPDTDSVGTRPVSQEKPKEELAETGAAETTFLLIGAATMIAGGVGFRLMPRLANRNTVA